MRSRRVAKRCCPALRFWRALVFVVGSGGAKMELPLFGTQLQNQSRCGARRRRLPLNVATVAPNRHWCFGRSRQLVSASQINTTLSSESLENRYRRFEFTSLRQRVT